MEPSSLGLSFEARKIDVGPSAPPIMAIEEASLREKLIPGIYLARSMAPIRVEKIPNWAAAPSNVVRGFASNGPKSVIAPTPMNIIRGKMPVFIPASYTYRIIPPSSLIKARGILQRMAPIPMGIKRRGSNCLEIPRYMRSNPTPIMSTLPTPSVQLIALLKTSAYRPVLSTKFLKTLIRDSSPAPFSISVD